MNFINSDNNSNIEPFEVIQPNQKNPIPDISEINNRPKGSGEVSVMESMKATYNKILGNKNVSIIINPFQDDSYGVQLCYKIYSAITCLIVLLVILLSIFYS